MPLQLQLQTKMQEDDCTDSMITIHSPTNRGWGWLLPVVELAGAAGATKGLKAVR